MAGEIGFSHNTSENPALELEVEVRVPRGTLVYTKTRERPGLFLYSCAFRPVNATPDSTALASTGFRSDRDLTEVEIRKLGQFSDFVRAYSQAERH